MAQTCLGAFTNVNLHVRRVKLVVTGDFFQLPPVNKGGEPNFVFEAETWKEAIHKSINLTKVFRQRDESELRTERLFL